jgi:hypothetical protein
MFYLQESTDKIATIFRQNFQFDQAETGVPEEVGHYFWASDEVHVRSPLSLEDLEEVIRACRTFIGGKPEKYRAFTKEWLEAFQPELAKTYDWDEHPEGYDQACYCGECRSNS